MNIHHRVFQTHNMGHLEVLESPRKKTTSGKAETNYTLCSLPVQDKVFIREGGFSGAVSQDWIRQHRRSCTQILVERAYYQETLLGHRKGNFLKLHQGKCLQVPTEDKGRLLPEAQG